ncbi:hypothetical protein IWZ03DRAFT_419225 [Phyllosticta citriasiana]|uniref:Uncharacterized protein n=1 Tax=Phyllosticta citriasiana TaxID=595635 RepID=A0ABR1K779_9PEZI
MQRKPFWELPARSMHLLVISSAELSNKGRDITLVMIRLYYWLFPIPHADKEAMERLIEAEYAKPASERVIKGVGGDEDAAIGYTVSRNDVGLWIFEHTVKKA